MSPGNALTYKQVVLIAVSAELTLIAIQFIYLKIFASINPETELAFTSDYMKSQGFYIFQVVGFFLYTLIAFVVSGKLAKKILNKILVLVLTGGVLELSFYLVMQVGYEGVFIYSILDKFVAAAFGLIIYNYTTKNIKKPDSYL